MAVKNNNATGISASELKDLRALRALVAEARGVVASMADLEFALGLPMDDALAAYGLAGSEWAHEHLAEIRAALDEPLEAEADAGVESAELLAA